MPEEIISNIQQIRAGHEGAKQFVTKLEYSLTDAEKRISNVNDQLNKGDRTKKWADETITGIREETDKATLQAMREFTELNTKLTQATPLFTKEAILARYEPIPVPEITSGAYDKEQKLQNNIAAQQLNESKRLRAIQEVKLIPTINLAEHMELAVVQKDYVKAYYINLEINSRTDLSESAGTSVRDRIAKAYDNIELPETDEAKNTIESINIAYVEINMLWRKVVMNRSDPIDKINSGMKKRDAA